MSRKQPKIHPAVLVTYHELAVARARVARALRQLVRAQEAHRAERQERLDQHFESGIVPESIMALATDFDDAMTFAVVAAHSAARSHDHLSHRLATPLPELRQLDALEALRNADEHWDEWTIFRPQPFGEDQRWRLVHSARAYEEKQGRGPYGGMSYTDAADGVPSRVTSWHVLDVDQLTADLEDLLGVLTTLTDARGEGSGC